MTTIRGVALAVRLFAVWLFVWCLRTMPTMIGVIRSAQLKLGDWLIYAFFLLLTLLVAGVLWTFPLSVAGRLFPGGGRAGAAQENTEVVSDWARVGCLVLGLWQLAEVIPDLGYGVTMLLLWHQPFTLVFKATMLAMCLRLAVGVWLLCGAPGIWRHVGWLTAARRKGASSPRGG